VAWSRGIENVRDLGCLPEYGLCFDYVPLETFSDQTEAYFRYQLSWGGPSDEFRFFTDSNFNVKRIEYWFLDWFDGASRVLSGSNKKLLTDLFEYYFKESGAVRVAHRKAVSEY